MEETPTQTITIGQMAKAAGVGVETVQLYKRKGLMAMSYSSYDIVARRCLGYGYVYSFQELGLGIEQLAGDLVRLHSGCVSR